MGVDIDILEIAPKPQPQRPLGNSIRQLIRDLGKKVRITIDTQSRICMFISPPFTAQEYNTFKDTLPEDFKDAWNMRQIRYENYEGELGN